TWAVLPSSGGACTPGCGFTTYGPTGVAANHLALAGTGSTQLGASATIVTTGLGAATTCVSLISLTAGDQPFLGGRLLVGLPGYLATIALPAAGGTSQWSVPIVSDPQVVGVSIRIQSAAADPALPVG